MNGVFILASNPQFSKALMDEIKKQGEELNMTSVAQVPFKAAEALQVLCERSDDYFLRNLAGQLQEIMEELRDKRLAYESRNRQDALDEEPLDDDLPSYGKK